MAFASRSTADEASGGFDQLLVVGLKLSANETDTQQLIEDLIQNHHYSAKGFALVRQGTPTNNTDNDSSGFGATDPQARAKFFRREQARRYSPSKPNADKATDGQRFAEYLGVDYEALAHIAGADATDHAEAIAMNKALYAGTLGYYLNTLLNDVMSNDTTSSACACFSTNTSAVADRCRRCASAISHTVFCSRARSHGATAHLRTVFSAEHRRERAARAAAQEWRTLKPQLPHISKDTDANANLIKVLGLQPTSADYYQRVGYSYDYLRNEQQFALGGRYFGDVIGMSFERNLARAFLAMFGYDPTPTTSRCRCCCN